MNLNDDDYPSPFKCWVSLLLLPVTIVVGVARLATSPAYRRVYRARQLRHREEPRAKLGLATTDALGYTTVAGRPDQPS